MLLLKVKCACVSKVIFLLLPSLVPRPSHSFCRLQYERAWERGYSGIFLREKFFADSCHVRSNGNFGGKISTVPLPKKKSHAYQTRVTLSLSSSSIRARMEGVTSESFTLQSVIRGPASLSRSSPPAPLGRLSLLYCQLRCRKQVPPLI